MSLEFEGNLQRMALDDVIPVTTYEPQTEVLVPDVVLTPSIDFIKLSQRSDSLIARTLGRFIRYITTLNSENMGPR